jgi:hypothetical protein
VTADARLTAADVRIDGDPGKRVGRVHVALARTVALRQRNEHAGLFCRGKEWLGRLW